MAFESVNQTPEAASRGTPRRWRNRRGGRTLMSECFPLDLPKLHIATGAHVNGYDVLALPGKLIVHRPTREEAIACMKRALDEFMIEGVKTTIPLARDILNHTVFINGEGDTKFVERTWRFS
jgi:hypothetical protein